MRAACCSCEVKVESKVESEAKLKTSSPNESLDSPRPSCSRDGAIGAIAVPGGRVLSRRYCYVDLHVDLLYVLTVSQLPAAREVESALACMQPAFHYFILSINLIYFLFSISLPASMRKALLSPFRLVTFRALRSSSAAASSMLTPAFAARTMAK